MLPHSIYEMITAIVHFKKNEFVNVMWQHSLKIKLVVNNFKIPFLYNSKKADWFFFWLEGQSNTNTLCLDFFQLFFFCFKMFLESSFSVHFFVTFNYSLFLFKGRFQIRTGRRSTFKCVFEIQDCCCCCCRDGQTNEPQPNFCCCCLKGGDNIYESQSISSSSEIPSSSSSSST